MVYAACCRRFVQYARPRLSSPSSTTSSIRLTSTFKERSPLQGLAEHYRAQGDTDEQAKALAKQELRWIRHHARSVKSANTAADGSSQEDAVQRIVRKMTEENMPLAYALGSQPFYPLPKPLIIRPPILIPRPETEHWVHNLTESLIASERRLRKPFRILDIGTGSGCIPLALTHLLPFHTHVVSIDISNDALALASENLALNPPPNSSSTISFRRFDILKSDPEDLIEEGQFDLVVSNPPYIPRKEYEALAASVKDWEDIGALVGGEDEAGLDFYYRIAEILPSLLVKRRSGEEEKDCYKRPRVALEVGHGQAQVVRKLLATKAGFNTDVVMDPWGVERCIIAW